MHTVPQSLDSSATRLSQGHHHWYSQWLVQTPQPSPLVSNDHNPETSKMVTKNTPEIFNHEIFVYV